MWWSYSTFLLLVGIQLISINGQSCRHRTLQGTFIRCCRLDKYFTTSSIEECVAKCNEYNAKKQPSENQCLRVNWHIPAKECSLLYIQGNDANSAQIMSSHVDFTAAELDCSGGGAAPAQTPATTPRPTAPPPPPPPQPSKGVGCGKQASQYQPVLPNKSTRIIGGNTAKPHSWPWQVSLRSGESRFHFCGGSLLRVHEDKEESDIVLTAAHCVPITNGKVGDFSYTTVAIGTNTRSLQNIPGEQSRKIAAIEFHENYKDLVNDIALIKLDKPVRFSDTIRPICLARDNEAPPTTRTCVATGFGRNETNSAKSQDELKQTLAPVHSIETCQKTWYWQYHAWTYAFICAGALDASSTTCNGDSGGPLVCKYEDGSWVQHGVVSYGPNDACTAVNQPPVFSRVATYAPWIRQKINKLSAVLNG